MMVFTQSGARDFLDKITGIIEANLSNEQFGVNELAREMGMSRSNLHRKIKSATGISISQFIQQVRLKKAMELLQQTSSTVSEVAFECGFHSVSYFTTCFHDHYGYPPGKAGKSEANQYNLSVDQQHHSKPGFSKKWLTIILSSVIFVIIAVLVLFFIFRPFTKSDQHLEKSIAVLPFHNDSPDEENVHFIDGTMEAIIGNLCKIENIRVISRTSVEQYRNTSKSVPEIAKELNVSYILEGSGQKYGENIQLTVQLLDAVHDKNIWSNPYSRKIDDIFTLQSEIAQSIASEIKAIIIPEEKQLIEKRSTTNLTAYDFYQRGNEELWKYRLNGDFEALEITEDLYHKALQYDSTFAQAYTGLAMVYLEKQYLEESFSESTTDSILILTNIALSYDEQLAEAYSLQGQCYLIKGLEPQALKEWDKAIKFNPNDWMAYLGKGNLYLGDGDLVNGIDNYQRAVSLSPQSEMKIYFLVRICWACTYAGFTENAKYYAREAFKLKGDSALYNSMLGWIEYYLGNYEKAIELFETANELYEKVNAINTINFEYLGDYTKNFEFLGECYMMYGRYEESLKYYKKWIERVKDPVKANILHAIWVGYVYWKNGYKEEAEYYFNEIFNSLNEVIKEGQKVEPDFGDFYIFAEIYTFKGDKDKAIENLNLFNQIYQKQRISGLMWLFNIKHDPLFDSIRDEPEFQRIVRDMEAKYQAEHKRIRKLMEEHGML